MHRQPVGACMPTTTTEASFRLFFSLLSIPPSFAPVVNVHANGTVKRSEEFDRSASSSLYMIFFFAVRVVYDVIIDSVSGSRLIWREPTRCRRCGGGAFLDSHWASARASNACTPLRACVHSTWAYFSRSCYCHAFGQEIGAGFVRFTGPRICCPRNTIGWISELAGCFARLHVSYSDAAPVRNLPRTAVKPTLVRIKSSFDF